MNKMHINVSILLPTYDKLDLDIHHNKGEKYYTFIINSGIITYFHCMTVQIADEDCSGGGMKWSSN